MTSTRPEEVRLAESHDFTFVLDGPAAAVDAARRAAGSRNVYVMGGGQLIAGCLAAGLLDVLQLHLSPEILGDGTPLFAGVGRQRLVQRDVRVSASATHLTYDVTRRPPGCQGTRQEPAGVRITTGISRRVFFW